MHVVRPHDTRNHKKRKTNNNKYSQRTCVHAHLSYPAGLGRKSVLKRDINNLKIAPAIPGTRGNWDRRAAAPPARVPSRLVIA